MTIVGAPAVPPGSVPEPSTVALLFAALALFGVRHERRAARDPERRRRGAHDEPAALVRAARAA